MLRGEQHAQHARHGLTKPRRQGARTAIIERKQVGYGFNSESESFRFPRIHFL